MPNEQKEKIAKMDWGEFESKLQAAPRRAVGAPTGDQKAMIEYFGKEEFEELKALAQQAKKTRGQPASRKGNIVFLPGIMGSNLTARKDRVSDHLVWVDLINIVSGYADWLRLSDDGKKEQNPAYEVRASLIDKRTYSRAILKLSARWNVEPFAFDWRKDLDDAADALDEFIKKKFVDNPEHEDKPLHLVAHSMGGLVCRNFIHRHKDTWQKMRGDGDGDGAQPGRLIMMGTPNYGSFAIPQVMTGDEKQVRWLSVADLKHSLDEILSIINTFVGSYLMLPDPEKVPEIKELYKRESWGKFPVSATHLARSLAFHRQLQDPATINPERMRYIAGCNQKTLTGLRIAQPGKFSYTVSYDGDGRVPYKLGLLEGVPTYYVEEGHGRLPKNDKVIAAVEQLLEQEKTTLLATTRLMPRAAVPDKPQQWHRRVGEYLVQSEIEKVAKQIDRANKDPKATAVDPDDRRVVEETIMRALIGDDRPPARRKEDDSSAKTGRKRKLAIQVLGGDITEVATPVVVVGHYKGVTPINAIGAIDKKLDGWISYATKQSMIGGEVGQVFFVPIKNNQIAAEAVLIGGMGEEGKFNRYDLRYMMLNVTYAIAALKVKEFATLVIGAGAGNLTIEHALRAMIFGICDALDRLDDKTALESITNTIEKITLIERNPVLYNKIVAALKDIVKEDSAANLDIELLPGKKLAGFGEEGPKAEDRVDRQTGRMGPRITVEREGDVFHFSALAQNAVVPVRQVDIQSFYPLGISERLMESSSREEQEMFGRLLCTTLLPEDFQRFYDTEESLTLILDRNTASFPWEMACYGKASGIAFFGTNLKLTRQFRTLLSAAPGIAPKLKDKLKVLVIADPAPEPELQLPGARDEGYAVVRILTQIKHLCKLDIEIIDRIGPEECDPMDILGLILNEVFDVIHFAGHGVFDEKKPSNSGWVFGGEPNQPDKLRLLSAREIFRARRVPRVVFSNACFSAVVNNKIESAQEMNKSLAGLAEAFFERGVQNYIGAGWPVQDDLAVQFATEFYTQALTGRRAKDFPIDAVMPDKGNEEVTLKANPASLGEALSAARNLILHNGSTWGAYQHYGQADDFLINLTPAPEESPKRKSTRRKSAKRTAAQKPRAKRVGRPSKGATKSNGRKR